MDMLFCMVVGDANEDRIGTRKAEINTSIDVVKLFENEEEAYLCACKCYMEWLSDLWETDMATEILAFSMELSEVQSNDSAEDLFNTLKSMYHHSVENRYYRGYRGASRTVDVIALRQKSTFSDSLSAILAHLRYSLEKRLEAEDLDLSYVDSEDILEAIKAGVSIPLYKLEHCKLDFSGHSFGKEALSGMNLKNWILCGASFVETNLCFCSLEGLDLSNVNFEKVNLSHANLTGTNLSNANLSHANLTDANFQNSIYNEDTQWPKGFDYQNSGALGPDSKLSSIGPLGPDSNLIKADLRYANLRGVNLREANLSHANLSHANLENADLTNANLQRADLEKALLQYSICTDVNFQGANLHDADLRNACVINGDLRGADVRGAYLKDTMLGGAKYNHQTKGLECIDIESQGLKFVD